MKLFTLFFVAASAIVLLTGVNCQRLSPEQADHFKGAIDSCMADHHLSDWELRRMSKQIYTGTKRHAKCFVKCFGTKVGMYVNGALKPDFSSGALTSVFGKEQVEKAFQICDKIQDADECERTFKLFKCYKHLRTSLF